MLSSLAAELRHLEARLHDPEATPRQTLVVGQALLAFAAREHQFFSNVAPLLDPAAQSQLMAAHQAIAEDLELLEWLLAALPDSPDIPVLTVSLVRRMRDHIERDGRLLTRAATLQA